MEDSDSPEQPTSKETGIPTSWGEIRNKYQRSRYSETYQIATQTFKLWEATPRSTMEIAAWNRAIDTQIEKAKQLPNVQRDSATIKDTQEEVGKISAIGKEIPPFGQEKMTRVYIGTDPKKSTDAYVALLDSLEAQGVLKDIVASLYLDLLTDPNDRKLHGNSIIIYDPMSRPEVLDKVLQAYKDARLKNPEAFSLTPRQRAAIMRENLRNFHATIDANVSFVEQPTYRKGGSFDTRDRVSIQNAFAIGSGEYTDEEWFQRTHKNDANGIVLSYTDEQKINSGQVNPGEVLSFERKLSAPAIVQEGTITLK